VVAGGYGRSISCGQGTQKSLEYMRGGTEERISLSKLISHASSSPSISTNVLERTCQSVLARRLACDRLLDSQGGGWNGVFEVWQFVEVVDHVIEWFNVAELGVHVEEVVGNNTGYAVADSFFDYDRAEAFSYGIFNGVADTSRCCNAGDDQGVDAVSGQELVQIGARESRRTLFLDDQFAFLRCDAGVDVCCAGGSI